MADPTAAPSATPAPPAARVLSLRLTDFRNYATLALASGGASAVVLTGPNGAGKTNLLEALSFLSPGRGLRRAGYETIGRTGGPGNWAVAAVVDGGLGETRIGTGFAATGEGSREIRIEGVAQKRSEALLDHLRVSWLTPAQDGLFTGPPADRRRFLDRLVLALDPAHGSRVTAYETAMRGRNRLLEDPRADRVWLDGIETQLAELGVAIAAARRDLVGALTAAIAGAHDPASAFPHAVLTLDGAVEADLDAMSAAEAEDRLRRALGDGRHLDRAAGRTLAGPHRSDLVVSHGPKDVPAETASTGEQKALLTGLVLAHARLVAARTGFAPVLLLDEIAAHLDARRREGLFAALDRLGSQAWMTGTDAALFSALEGRAAFFRVEEGEVHASVEP